MPESNATEFPETRSELLVQIKSLDNREAWERFVKLYRPVIYRIARRRGFQEADAQDVTQRVLASVANSIHRWKKLTPAVRFRHWLRRIVRNAIINSVTRRPKDVATGGLVGHQQLLECVIDPESEREIALEYRRELFQQAAGIVQREVTCESWRLFELTVVEGRTVEDAAAVVNKSVGAAYAARSRVMRRIKDAVKRIEEL